MSGKDEMVQIIAFTLVEIFISKTLETLRVYGLPKIRQPVLAEGTNRSGIFLFLVL